MNGDSIKELLEKIPVGLVLVLFLGYLGYDFYSFTNDEASPLVAKQHEAEAARGENERLQVKVNEGQAFLRTLDAKRDELRRLAGELETMKGTLSESFDLSEFMRTTITEAKKVGLVPLKVTPAELRQQEFYAEQPFDFAFRGVYVQLMVFLERMANVQRIVRVDNFDVKPVSSSGSRYVELEGTVQIKAYRYLASRADELAKEQARNASGAGAGSVPKAPAAPPADGAPAPPEGGSG